MTTITAKTILSTQHGQVPDLRLSTILARYPRTIHSEMLTHRDKTRNSASSRALPIWRMLEEAEKDPAVPMFWGKHQKGMQAYEELEGSARDQAINIWHEARLDAIKHVKKLNDLELHKQVANRLLEPFIHITVLYSGTQWSNMLALRDHHAAEPHIQLLAKEFAEELKRSPMQVAMPGTWHIPFIYPEEAALPLHRQQTLGVARCASTSYRTVDGFQMDELRAKAVYESLLADTPIHASPAEHVAQVDHFLGNDIGGAPMWQYPEDHRNYRGFRQLRALLPNETL